MKYQTIIGIFLILLIFGLIFWVKTQHDKIQELKATTKSHVEQKDIGKGITRAESKELSKKDLESIIKDKYPHYKLIKKDLKKLDAKPTAIHTIKAVTPGYVGDDLPTTETTPNPNPPSKDQPITDKFGYFEATQWIKLEEPFSDGTKVPYGRVGFSAWKENPWSLDITPRKYTATTILGQDENGRHYAYSRLTINADGESYTVPIEENTILESLPKAKFRFDPRLYLGVEGGIIANAPAHAEVTPMLGMSIFSFGEVKTNPTWTFLTIGAGYATQAKAPVVSLAPVRYNIGKPLPLVSNLHIGPSLSLDIDGNIGVYFGVAVGL